LTFANDQRPTTNDYFTYFPNINRNFSFVAAGISTVGQNRVRKARPHLQSRAGGIAATRFHDLPAFSRS